ncbi:MAG: type V CRISPR-associated protein Cas4 [Patescibacteria group bacterium]
MIKYAVFLFMEQYIQISKLNDFIFCPHSVYLHSIYENFSQKTYHRAPQTIGKIKHENIEKGAYSTAKRYLQNTPVYSNKYGLAGKIDIYDAQENALIERKYKIKKIYDGYRYQLYAQYFCLIEMEYPVKKIYFHSLSDNKRYAIKIPQKQEIKEFKNIVEQMQNFDPAAYPIIKNKNKCRECVYKPLCH